MFGAHATTAPEPDAPTVDSTSSLRRWLLIGLALLVAVAGWFVVRAIGGDDSSAAVDCSTTETTTVTMTVAPAMADLVDAAVASLEDNGQCIELDVSTASVAEVAAAQDEVNEGEEDVLPDLWLPDSPAWQIVLRDADLSGRVVVPTLATTPVGLASGSEGRVPATWLGVLESPQLVKMDPRANGASALAMVAPFSEAAEGLGDPVEAQRAIVPVAQRFGAKVAGGQVRPVTIDTLPSSSKRLVPVTERDFLIAKRGNDALTWFEPETGVGVLEYPIVQPHAGASGIGVGGGAIDVAGRTADKIAEWFASDEGLAAIAAEQLRAPDGAPLPDDQSITDGKQLPAAEKNQVDSTMESWFTLTVPSSILVAIEDSSAMAAANGATTRLAVATGAATTALAALPDHARLALWGFSTNLGGGDQDWREFAPYRRLDAPTGKGETQRDLLDQQATVLPSVAGGGTGLYDTLLAAYQLANREYNPAYSNSVAVMTTGTNDDPGSITLDQLIEELKLLHDPDRPVRIIPIGIGADADMAALQRIADVSSGQAFEATTASDVLTVLAQSLLSR